MQIAEVISLGIALKILLQSITQITMTVHVALLELFNHQGRVPGNNLYLILELVDIEEYLAHIKCIADHLVEDRGSVEIGLMRLLMRSGHHLEGILHQVDTGKGRGNARNLIPGRGAIGIIDVVAVVTIVGEGRTLVPVGKGGGSFGI